MNYMPVMRARLPLIILLLHAALFGVLGVLSLVDIDGLLAATDIGIPTAKARIELVTFYGGLELGLAAFLVFCWRKGRTDLGLWLCLITYIGLGAVRTGAMLVAGTAEAPLFTLLITEVVGGALAAIGLRLLPTAPDRTAL